MKRTDLSRRPPTAVASLRRRIKRTKLATVSALVLLMVAIGLSGLLAPGCGTNEQVPPGGSANASTDAGDTPPVPGGVVPTYEWVNFYGLESVSNGEPLAVGAVITAHDPDGVVCGEVSVSRTGRYGLMPVFRDDPATEADEGAIPGDLIRFRINGVEATATGPDEPVWIAMGDLKHLNLAASPAP